MSNGPHYEQGRYRARVIGQGLSKSRDKETPFLWLRIKVLSLENGDDVDQNYDRTVTEYITSGTMPYLAKKLKSLGFTQGKISVLEPEHPQHHSFVDTEGIFICLHENNYEKWQMAWEGDNFKADMKPLDSRSLRELDQLFGKQTRETSPTPTAAPARIATSSQMITDDDLPF